MGAAAAVTTVRESVNAIGWCIAGASTIILACVVMDAWKAVAGRKWWFPCSLVRINAVTLAVLSVATKLPNDISTPMRGIPDQLAKLSGSALICALTAFTLPTTAEIHRVGAPSCLSTWQGPRVSRADLVSNVAALGLLVVTTGANVGTQMVTGVISWQYNAQHVLLLAATLLCFGNLATAALFLPDDLTSRCLAPFLSPPCHLHMQSSWLIARASSKQYSLSRTVFGCGGGGIFSFFSVLCISLGFSKLGGGRQTVFQCDSDYGWSTWFVLITQSLTILVCWACVTTRCLRPLLFTLEHDFFPKLPDCLNLKVLWEESAFEDDVAWWKTQTTKEKFCKRILTMCKRVPCCVVQWVMMLLCAWPSMLLWLFLWKLSRYPASWVRTRLYSEEELNYFKEVIEPDLTNCLTLRDQSKQGHCAAAHAQATTRSSIIMKMQGLWLSNKPREALQRTVSKERVADLSNLVQMLREYDKREATSLLEMKAEWPGLDVTNKRKPWPLSVCASALILMEVWKGLVFTQDEVENARQAFFQGGQVAHLVELLTNPNAEDRRSTQRVLVDLFTTKKAVSRISISFRSRLQRPHEVHSLLEDVSSAAHAVNITKPHAKLCSTAERLKHFANALLLLTPPPDEDVLQWIKKKVKMYLVCILGDYFQRFPELEEEACRIARNYDCEDLCILAFLGSLKAQRVWISLDWESYPFTCSFTETSIPVLQQLSH